MKLSKYIEEEYGRNTSEFARQYGVSQTQARRWVVRDCKWLDGAVYCKVKEHKGRGE